MDTKYRVTSFVEQYKQLCEEYGIVLIGADHDFMVLPADIQTMKNRGLEDEVMDEYFDLLNSTDVVSNFVNIVEDNSNG